MDFYNNQIYPTIQSTNQVYLTMSFKNQFYVKETHKTLLGKKKSIEIFVVQIGKFKWTESHAKLYYNWDYIDTHQNSHEKKPAQKKKKNRPNEYNLYQ